MSRRLRNLGGVALLLGLAGSVAHCLAAPALFRLIAAEKTDRQLVDELTDYVEAQGVEGDRRLFDALARMLGMSLSNLNESIKQVDAHLSDAQLHTVWVRHSSGTAPPQILLMYVIKQDDTVKSSYYVTSSDGRLRKAARKETSKSPQFLTSDEIGDAYRQELDFWQTWAENNPDEKVEK